MFGKFAASVVLASAAFGVSAAPMSVDGVIGAEWTGASTFTVAPGPNGVFGGSLPTATPGYTIYLRSDSQYLYAGVKSVLPGSTTNLFTNLYFGILGSQGTVSAIGFETTNDRAFQVGGPANTYFTDGMVQDGNSGLIQYSIHAGAANDASVIEAAFDLSIFNSNALGVTGYGLVAGESAVGAGLFLSQSLGFGVVGFPGNPAFVRVAFAAQQVPEPGSLALLGLGLAGLAAVRKRKQA